MSNLTKQQVEELIDEIAREWDGCSYDDAMVPDIGEAIRQAARPRINALLRDATVVEVKS